MAAIRDYWEEKCIVFDLKGIDFTSIKNVNCSLNIRTLNELISLINEIFFTMAETVKSLACIC